MFVGRTVWEVNQGREGDFIGVCRRSSEIHKRLGAVNVALIAHSTGPGHLMTYVLHFETVPGTARLWMHWHPTRSGSPWGVSS